MTRRDVLRYSGAFVGAPLVSVFGAGPPAAAPAPGSAGSASPSLQPETTMLLVRDIFQCKPGHARALAETLQKVTPILQEKGALGTSRILVDYIADYWTVIWEADVENLDEFEHHMQVWGASPEVREIMKDYLDHVEGGRREVYRIFAAT